MKTKKCSKCGKTKTTNDFYSRGKTSTLHSACKDCEREMYRKWYSKNRERAKKKYREWRTKNPEKIKEYRKRNRGKNYRQECSRKYGVSVGWIDNQLNRQNGKCSVCGSVFVWGEKQKCPHVDHNHTTGEVRGLLCNRCNIVLGLVNESIEIIQSLGEYICHGTSTKH